MRFPACGVKLHLQHPTHDSISGRGLEDVYCATSPTLEYVLDKDEVPVYIGVGCCSPAWDADAGVCHRYAGTNDGDGCFAGWYDDTNNVLGNPKTWDQAVELCYDEGKELCAGDPTASPVLAPSPRPTTASPVLAPTPEPSPAPSPAPTSVPISRPSLMPTPKPSHVPTAVPSSMPSLQPSSHPTPVPSSLPTSAPTPDPTSLSSLMPTPRPALVRQRARRLSRQGVCQGTGCHYDFGYQWSTTECEPGDANYQEGCEAGGGGGGGKKTGGGGGGKKTGVGGAAGTITMVAAWLGIGLCCCLAAVLAVRCRRRAAKREDGTVAPAPPAVLEMSNVKGQGAPIMHAQTVPPVTAPPQIVMPQLGPPMLVQPQILESGVPVPAHLPVAELMPAASGFCAKCRAPLAAGAAFCGRCGQAV